MLKGIAKPQNARAKQAAWRKAVALFTVLMAALILNLGADDATKEAKAANEAKKEEFSIETQRQNIPLTRTKSLRIINHLGDVRARHAKGSDLNVISVIQLFRKDQNDAKTLIANGVRAVGEGANMPTEPEAVRALQSAGVVFVPGKAANAGGVACSGLEMSQNSLRLSWTREEVDTRLQGIMASIHQQCVKHGGAGEHVDYVKGANLAGFIKVADAMLSFGVV